MAHGRADEEGLVMQSLNTLGHQIDQPDKAFPHYRDTDVRDIEEV
jgi:hypothetical protein